MDASTLTTSTCPWWSAPGCDQHETRCVEFPKLLGQGNKGRGMPSRHKSVKGMPKQCTSTSVESASKGAISMLQEFVQSSQTFSVPSNYSVLQWTIDSQMADAATLEFRAIVVFLLEGVPHHVAGMWQPKKRDAQRDAAERALNLFVGKWSEQIASTAHGATPMDNQKISPSVEVQTIEEDLLHKYCQQSDACCGTPPSWIVTWDAGACQATVSITLLGVPHQFAGAAQCSAEAARVDAAKRVLWYLQCPGFQDLYEPHPAAAAIVSGKIPSAPANWARDSVSDDALEVAERKTAIMRVQNRLQQTFSQQLRPGLSVWTWSYEMDPKDEDWPVLCCASVNIPIIGKTFTGDWRRGQRDAQLDAIRQVTTFLDGMAGQ